MSWKRHSSLSPATSPMTASGYSAHSRLKDRSFHREPHLARRRQRARPDTRGRRARAHRRLHRARGRNRPPRPNQRHPIRRRRSHRGRRTRLGSDRRVEPGAATRRLRGSSRRVHQAACSGDRQRGSNRSALAARQRAGSAAARGDARGSGGTTNGGGPEPLFRAVADEVQALLGASLSVIVRFEDDGTATTLGTPSGLAAAGTRHPLDPNFAVGSVRRTRRAARFETDDPTAAGMPAVVRETGMRSAVASPIFVEGEVWGAICVASRVRSLPPDTERRLDDFTDLVATAIVNADFRDALARLAEEQAALRRVATLVAEEVAPERIFAAVCEQVGQLLEADISALEIFPGDGTATLIAVLEQGRAVRAGREASSSRARHDRRPSLLDPGAGAEGGPQRRGCKGWPVCTRPAADLDGRSADPRRRPTLGRARWQGRDAVIRGQRRPKPGWLHSPSWSPPRSPTPSRAMCASGSPTSRRRCAASRRSSLAMHHPGEVFDAVAMEVGTLLDADITVVGRYDDDGAATAIGSWSASPGGVTVGTRSVVGGHNVLDARCGDGEAGAGRRVRRSSSGEAAEIARRHGWRSSIAAPIIVEGRALGCHAGRHAAAGAVSRRRRGAAGRVHRPGRHGARERPGA